MRNGLRRHARGSGELRRLRRDVRGAEVLQREPVSVAAPAV
jgi:hypothetical protein